MSFWPGDAEREVTTFGRLSRGALMARVRSKGNKTTEMRLARLLSQAGLRGWRRHHNIPGRPDFVWHAVKVAVFADGCFWHGHCCGKNISPRTNTEAWINKINRNRARDRKTARVLRGRGWVVIRLWECQLLRNPTGCVDKIRRALRTRR